MHSPFGRLWPVVEKTGWSMHYILWKVPWMLIPLMMADAPGIKRVKKGKKKKMSGKQYIARRRKKSNG